MSRKGSLPFFFQLRCEGDVRMPVVKVVKKKRYMVEGFEEKKTVINVTSIHKRLKGRRTVVKPRFFMERLEDVSNKRTKRTTHSYAFSLLINAIKPFQIMLVVYWHH